MISFSPLVPGSTGSNTDTLKSPNQEKVYKCDQVIEISDILEGNSRLASLMKDTSNQ